MIHRVLSVHLMTVECDTEQIVCVTLKTGQQVSKNTAELQAVKKKRQYFLFFPNREDRTFQLWCDAEYKNASQIYTNIYFTQDAIFKVATIILQYTEII